MPGIFSNTCRIKPLPWQQAKSWRHDQRRETSGHRTALLCPNFPLDYKSLFLLQTCWWQTFWWWALAGTKRCLKEALGTWELLDKHSHKLRTPPSYWLDPSWKPYQWSFFCLSLFSFHLCLSFFFHFPL